MPLPQQVIGIDTSGLPGPRVLTVQGIGPGGSFANPPVPYDSLLISNPSSGVVATVTFPATPNKRWLISMLLADLFEITLAATAAQTSAIQVLDDVVEIFRARLITPAVVLNGMALSEFNMVGLAITGTAGNAVTVRFNPAPNAAGNESLAVGAYII
jgi:hypothetical protein